MAEDDVGFRIFGIREMFGLARLHNARCGCLLHNDWCLVSRVGVHALHLLRVCPYNHHITLAALDML